MSLLQIAELQRQIQRRDARIAELEVSQPVTAPAQAEQPTDSTPKLHVGESSFEGWYATLEGPWSGDKQLARDAYAAGMGDPLVTYAQPVPPALSMSMFASTSDYEEAKLAQTSRPADTCRRCHGPMQPGKAIAQTFGAGTPDFPGDTHGITISPGGPGKLIDCIKCSDCGWSVTNTTKDEQ